MIRYVLMMIFMLQGIDVVVPTDHIVDGAILKYIGDTKSRMVANIFIKRDPTGAFYHSCGTLLEGQIPFFSCSVPND